MSVSSELRTLMSLYYARVDKIKKDMAEAKDDDDTDAEIACEIQIATCRSMISELFQTMKSLGVLDDEEIEFGSIKID